MLAPPRPRNTFDVDLGNPADAPPLYEKDLSSLSNALLTFETEAVLDATQMEISLLKPQTKKVSKARFEQLSLQLYQSFNQLQLRSYYDNAPSEGPDGLLPSPGKYAPKVDYIRAILRVRWGIVIAEEIQEYDDLIIEEITQTTKQGIFFLVGEGMIHSCSIFKFFHSLASAFRNW